VETDGIAILCNELNRMAVSINFADETGESPTTHDKMWGYWMETFESLCFEEIPAIHEEQKERNSPPFRKFGLDPYARAMIWNHAPPSLLELPSTYSKLHARVMAVTEAENPAMCLACGAVMAADGTGQCTAHVKRCSGDSGVVFLLQVPITSFSCLPI
jgi:hypothetical protein